ncbi:hypothetical protein FB384_004923 [Prauserella sediminis]|uniref:Uncharacterized protein n=1 Tax=Prauserella sediminis TaxID=577680 RepID=A0A839XX85_9PSEU|nr:hypothetical protein [Prauserella sediminis]MBB3665964.1 hypothetical protein [Prauserella sediminis]
MSRRPLIGPKPDYVGAVSRSSNYLTGDAEPLVGVSDSLPDSVRGAVLDAAEKVLAEHGDDEPLLPTPWEQKGGTVVDANGRHVLTVGTMANDVERASVASTVAAIVNEAVESSSAKDARASVGTERDEWRRAAEHSRQVHRDLVATVRGISENLARALAWHDPDDTPDVEPVDDQRYVYLRLGGVDEPFYYYRWSGAGPVEQLVELDGNWRQTGRRHPADMPGGVRIIRGDELPEPDAES